MVSRDELNRMLRDCEAGKIDLILTKFFSRWNRNFLEVLIALNYLSEKTSKSVLRSRDQHQEQKGVLSHCCRCSHHTTRKSFQKRKRQMGMQCNSESYQFLRLQKDQHGNLAIVPEEAEIACTIYSLYLDRYGYRWSKTALKLLPARMYRTPPPLTGY